MAEMNVVCEYACVFSLVVRVTGHRYPLMATGRRYPLMATWRKYPLMMIKRNRETVSGLATGHVGLAW
ncbi:uncharacterized protein DS421_17g586260 [Arachis hypogaea]|nr:uncharacterized protein DS421_17g586260 [Arachis hypogaea]